MDTNLTEPMRLALERIGRCMVWADRRSVLALIRRGLVEQRGGQLDDALIGQFYCYVITEKGKQVLKGVSP